MAFVTASTVWVLFGTALVMLMILGYALFDVGSVRNKNSTGTVVRHLVVTFTSVLGFLFMGFGLFFGGSGGFFGVLDFFTLGNYGPDLPDGVSLSLFVASQAVVCAVVSNIVCGAMAERANLASQVAVSLVVSLLVFPFVSRWTWGTGWLAQLGFHDFAGSSSINVVAGVVSLVAAQLLGPRAEKYGPDGTVRALPGQSLTRCFIGTMLVVVGWFGLVACSLLAYGTEGAESLGRAFLGLLASASASTLTAILVSQVRYGCVDLPMALNSVVGGLVAASSGADVMSPLLSGVVGVLAGLVVVFGIDWVERVLKVDDPVGAVATHGLCGLLGLLATGLMSDLGPIFSGADGLATLGAELLGAVAICAWTGLLSWAVLAVVRHAVDLRVLSSEEAAGLGLSGPSLNNAFAEYLPELVPQGLRDDAPHRVVDLPVDQAVPIELAGGVASYALKKVEVICNPTRLDALRAELAAVGVTGMTVIEAQGCGEQRGARETYRGVPVDVELIPKVQVDIVVSHVPVADVVRAARRALYTGHIGDGKIFVYGVAEAVKVRTGEHGFDAVQGINELSS